MKRIFIVGIADDKEKTIRFLQDEGALHVEACTKLTGEAEKQNSLLLQEARRLGHIRESLKTFAGDEPQRVILSSDKEFISRSERMLEELQEIRDRIKSLEKLTSDLTPWGDFNVTYLSELEKNSVFVQRFRLEGNSLPEVDLPEDAFVQIISEKPALQFFTIRIGKPVELQSAIPLRTPEKGLGQAEEELARLTTRENDLVRELTVLSGNRDVVEKHYLEVLNEANFTQCAGTSYTENMLFGLQGWIPAGNVGSFTGNLKRSGLSALVSIRDPNQDETAPTLFKNNWFIRRIEPLLKLYGMPDYRELDPSYFFAPFMILFFGICLGDAGYGAVFLLASIFIRKKFSRLSPSVSPVMRLCEIFSVSAIVIGLITGSVFGYRFLSREWILVDLDQQYGDPMILFYVSLGLGVVHLSMSYLMAVFQPYSKMEKLQKMGLLGVLWGGACLISQRIWFPDSLFMISALLFYAGIVFLASGVLVTFLFASDSRKLGTRLGLGLWSVYGLTGLVGDLLSYARLFGLGIATTAIASVMNDLAGMVYAASGKITGTGLAIIILVIGHAFNLLLSILGSTVHSARLHFVEAFKSFFKGGGIEYKPFNKIERS